MNIRNGVLSALAFGFAVGCAGDQTDTAATNETAEPAPPAATAAPEGPAAAGQPATAALLSREGQQIGTVTLTQEGNEVVISVDGRNFEGGPKAIRIHAVGQCQAPTFASVGGVFSPGGASAAGELPTVVVDPDDGVVHGEFRTGLVSLRPGEANSLLGGSGTAIVIHGSGDAASDIVACGVVTPA